MPHLKKVAYRKINKTRAAKPKRRSRMSKVLMVI